MMVLGHSNVHLPAEEYPSPTMPTIFADGVLNVAPGPQVVKFYLQRLVPSLKGTNDFLAQPFVQVTMPTFAFLQMAIFFENSIKELVAQKMVPQILIDQIRRDLEIAMPEAPSNG